MGISESGGYERRSIYLKFCYMVNHVTERCQSAQLADAPRIEQRTVTWVLAASCRHEKIITFVCPCCLDVGCLGLRPISSK